MTKRFKILAVDDDPANILVMKSALQDEYDILTAPNGYDAISKIKEHIPDLSGFDVCRVIKSYQEYTDSVNRYPFLQFLPLA